MKNKIISILKSVDWTSISPAVYVRYILMIIAIVNTFLTRYGLNPIPVSEDATYQIVSDIMTAVIFVGNTWCNNSVTTGAIKADEYLKKLKNGDLIDDIDELKAAEAEKADTTNE